jgi:hypothetical protein
LESTWATTPPTGAARATHAATAHARTAHTAATAARTAESGSAGAGVGIQDSDLNLHDRRDFRHRRILPQRIDQLGIEGSVLRVLGYDEKIITPEILRSLARGE